MDLVAVGYPSPLAGWAFPFLEKALRRIAPGLSVVRLDRFDTIPDLGRYRGGRLILSMFPNPAFAKACLETETRSLVFADDLVEAVRYNRATHGVPLHEALRPVSAGLVLAGPFARSRFGLIVRRELRGAPADILKMFLEHFELDVSDEAAEKICQEIGFEDVALSASLRRQSYQQPEVSDEDHHVIVQALGGLREHLERPAPGDVTWPRQCFLLGDKPNAIAPVAIDVTGRARIIFYGPYLHLPRGLWKARVLIGFSQDIRGMPFTIEAFSTELLGKARIFAAQGGIFEFEFEAKVTTPHEPIEVRIMNEEGAIEGHMGLVSISFKEWEAVPDEQPLAASLVGLSL